MKNVKHVTFASEWLEVQHDCSTGQDDESEDGVRQHMCQPGNATSNPVSQDNLSATLHVLRQRSKKKKSELKRQLLDMIVLCQETKEATMLLSERSRMFMEDIFNETASAAGGTH